MMKRTAAITAMIFIFAHSALVMAADAPAGNKPILVVRSGDVSGDLASPISSFITSRTRIRKSPDKNSAAYRILEKKEEIKVYGSKDGWVKVESKWKNEVGKPIVGYVWGEDVPQDVASKVGLKVERVKADATSPAAKGSPVPARVVSINLPVPKPAVDVKSIEEARDALSLQVKELQAENQKLKVEAAKREGNTKSIQSALANADLQVKHLGEERQKLVLELQTVKAQMEVANTDLQVLRTGGKNKLILLADSGEAVFFKGIGEAQMAASEGMSVIRFPLTASKKADKVLMGAKAEKHMNGAFVYYMLNSNDLVF